MIMLPTMPVKSAGADISRRAPSGVASRASRRTAIHPETEIMLKTSEVLFMFNAFIANVLNQTKGIVKRDYRQDTHQRCNSCVTLRQHKHYNIISNNDQAGEGGHG